MGCNCGGGRDGYAEVWQYREVGQPIRQFATQAEARGAQKAAGGGGYVMKTTVKKP